MPTSLRKLPEFTAVGVPGKSRLAASKTPDLEPTVDHASGGETRPGENFPPLSLTWRPEKETDPAGEKAKPAEWGDRAEPFYVR